MAGTFAAPRVVRKAAFTITELLIVIAIIAVLISILVAALSHALELGRRTKCTANQRTLAQGVHGYAVEHQGYGQILSAVLTIQQPRSDYQPRRYEYEWWDARGSGPIPNGRTSRGDSRRSRVRVPSPWPVAYGDYIGAPDLTTLDLADFPIGETIDMDALSLKRTVDVLRCPSDRIVAGHLGYPGVGAVRISYRINWDLFGEEGFSSQMNRWTTMVWRKGGMTGSALRGQLDRVFRPEQVLMFVDGGEAVPNMTVRDRAANGGALAFAGLLWFASRGTPFWSDFADQFPQAMTPRHGGNGGHVASYVDGHAAYLRPVAWKTFQGRRMPIRFSPNSRITPYIPHAPGPEPEAPRRR